MRNVSGTLNQAVLNVPIKDKPPAGVDLDERSYLV
jgi:hypothetical protein